MLFDFSTSRHIPLRVNFSESLSGRQLRRFFAKNGQMNYSYIGINYLSITSAPIASSNLIKSETLVTAQSAQPAS